MKFSIEEEYLREVDQKLKKIIDKNGHIVFEPNKNNQFDPLVNIIISQFISTKAAKSIFNNFKNSFNTNFLQPLDFQNLSTLEIKKLGLSTNKARSIKGLSELFIDQQLNDLNILSRENLHKNLLSVFGLGDWSVRMFEIFSLGRLDIFSGKDAGLRRAMNNLEMIKPESDESIYESYSEKWSPYRTVASLHLWKTVD